jgi:hypothetical protein
VKKPARHRRGAHRVDLRARGAEPGLNPELNCERTRFVDLRDGAERNLRFVAGLFGTTQDRATGALKPEFGGAVVHDEPP